MNTSTLAPSNTHTSDPAKLRKLHNFFYPIPLLLLNFFLLFLSLILVFLYVIYIYISLCIRCEILDPQSYMFINPINIALKILSDFQNLQFPSPYPEISRFCLFGLRRFLSVCEIFLFSRIYESGE